MHGDCICFIVSVYSLSPRYIYMHAYMCDTPRVKKWPFFPHLIELQIMLHTSIIKNNGTTGTGHNRSTVQPNGGGHDLGSLFVRGKKITKVIWTKKIEKSLFLAFFSLKIFDLGVEPPPTSLAPEGVDLVEEDD